jgi:LysM repeat protein
MRSPSNLRRLARLLLLVAALVTSPWSAAQAQTTEPAPPASPAGESVVVLAAGDIAKCNLEWDSYTGALLDTLPGTILGLGDNAYNQGSLQEFTDCYGPTWGRHKDRVYPVPGNHEYLTGGAEGYFTYFGDRATPLEPGCRKECKGYYSFDLGAWHIVALNSEINNNPGSEQDLWLRADLAAHPNVCTLAYWHKPRWSSGDHGSGASAPLFQAIYDYGVDIVLSGHDHNYERFAPQSPQGVPEPERGVRQFVVGTGGDTHRGFEEDPPNSEVRNADTWGVIKLTLHPTSYDWEFIPIAGQTFTDSGSANCVTFGSAPTTAVGAQPVLVATGTAGGATVGDSPALEVSNDLAESAATAQAAAATLPAGGLDYVVQAGDTLSLIALRYGLDWLVVAQVNGITNTEVIEVGQVIRLPGVDATSAVTTIALPAATPAASGATAAVAAPAPASAAGSITYTVEAGDTLFGIALQANITLQALLTANNMQEEDFLQIGQVLILPGRTTPLRATGTAAAASAPLTATVTATRTTVAATGSITTTRPATTTVAATAAATTPSLLPTPTPRAAAVTPAATTAGPSVHIVADGETIITIALEYDLDWQELLTLNGMGPDSILQIGQEIRLR